MTGAPYKKEVDWSVLHNGFTISTQSLFYRLEKDNFPRGINKKISIVLGAERFEASIQNINFNREKYPTHQDLLQIRYTENSPIAKHLRNLFISSYHYLFDIKQNSNKKRKQIKLPDNTKEYLIIYNTPDNDIFVADFILANQIEQTKNVLANINEESFELHPQFYMGDETACQIVRDGLIKYRKIDTAIGDNLKKLYDYKCQISGLNPASKYGCNVVEAHHIDYFTRSLNNDSSNIIIISPDFHRIIHAQDPRFDREKLAYIFANGVEEKLTLNLHL